MACASEGAAWVEAASRLPAEPKADPVEIDKSEGINMTAFAAPPDPSELVIDEKFTLWRDEEGDYIIQATERQQRGHFLVADGRTPEDAVWRMRQLLEMSNDFNEPTEAAPEAAVAALRMTSEEFQCLSQEHKQAIADAEIRVVSPELATEVSPETIAITEDFNVPEEFRQWYKSIYPVAYNAGFKHWQYALAAWNYLKSSKPEPATERAPGADLICKCPDWFIPVGRYTHHNECPLHIPFGDQVQRSDAVKKDSAILDEEELLLASISQTWIVRSMANEIIASRKRSKGGSKDE